MVHVKVLLTLQFLLFFSFFPSFFFFLLTLICGLEEWKLIHADIFLHFCYIYYTYQVRLFWTIFGEGETREL